MLQAMSGVVGFFGRLSFLVDENAHAFHFFISSLLQLLDRCAPGSQAQRGQQGFDEVMSTESAPAVRLCTSSLLQLLDRCAYGKLSVGMGFSGLLSLAACESKLARSHYNYGDALTTVSSILIACAFGPTSAMKSLYPSMPATP